MKTKKLLALFFVFLTIFSCSKVNIAPVKVRPEKLTITNLGDGKIQTMLDISNTYYTYIDFGDGSQGYGNNIIHQYKENGTYVVKVYYNQQSCTNDDVCTDFFVVALEETVKITELLGVDFEYKVENNGLVKFQSFSKNANVKTLSWDFGDGSNTSSGEYIEHTYASNGKYKVILSGSNTTTKKSALKEIVVIK